jgi:DMSO/TMAO reductase YedYZ molybdopterin-dependent catalytic subunit
VEAKEYLGTKLTPIARQRNNALKGTQHIDRTTYRLAVGGLVENDLVLSYEDLVALPQESRLVKLNCVEGWSFTAKWTGPTLTSVLNKAGVKPGATTVIFYTTDDPTGYTSLELDYIDSQNIIIALRLNDVTLPPERGFPFQVVAEGKFGYKWAKWVDRIELAAGDFHGYWEREGYNNNADIEGPAFER